MAGGDVGAGRVEDSGVRPVGHLVNDRPRAVPEDQAVAIVAQPVADTAIGDEDDSAREAGVVGVEILGGGDDHKAVGGDDHRGNGIGGHVVTYRPTGQVKRRSGVVVKLHPLVGGVGAGNDGVVLHLVDDHVGAGGSGCGRGRCCRGGRSSRC